MAGVSRQSGHEELLHHNRATLLSSGLKVLAEAFLALSQSPPILGEPSGQSNPSLGHKIKNIINKIDLTSFILSSIDDLSNLSGAIVEFCERYEEVDFDYWLKDLNNVIENIGKCKLSSESILANKRIDGDSKRNLASVESLREELRLLYKKSLQEINKKNQQKTNQCFRQNLDTNNRVKNGTGTESTYKSCHKQNDEEKKEKDAVSDSNEEKEEDTDDEEVEYKDDEVEDKSSKKNDFDDDGDEDQKSEGIQGELYKEEKNAKGSPTQYEIKTWHKALDFIDKTIFPNLKTLKQSLNDILAFFNSLEKLLKNHMENSSKGAFKRRAKNEHVLNHFSKMQPLVQSVIDNCLFLEARIPIVRTNCSAWE